jgi:SAM-dependent methyltransferase
MDMAGSAAEASPSSEDLAYYLEWDPEFWEPPFRFGLARAGDLAGKRVLEIGPRRGRMCAWFAAQGAKVVGGDLRWGFMAEAREESARSPRPFRLAQLRAERLPFRDETFDLIFTKSTFIYFDRAAALREMLRVLKPGGRVWMVENMRYNPLGLVLRLSRLARGFRYAEWRQYLRPKEIPSYAKEFTSYEHAEFHLISPIFRPLRLRGDRLRKFFAWESRLLRRFPFLARFAWLTCLVGRK